MRRAAAVDRKIALSLLALASILMAHAVYVAWPYTTDDAYIILRYSQNLAVGNGPTYNAGGPPVEGYSTFLWMVILAIPHLMGVSAVAFAKVLGTVLTVGYVVIAAMLAMLLNGHASKDRRLLLGSATAALLCAPYSTGVHAVSAMGTPLFAVTLTALFYCLTRFMEEPRPRWAVALSLAALSAALSRPEGNIAAMPAVAVGLLLSDRAGRALLLKWVGLAYLVPVFVYFAWRLRMYGHAFPLPFYVKVTHQTLLAGVPDVARFLAYVGVHLGAFILLGLGRLRGRVLPAMAGAAVLLLALAVPAHIVGFGSRYLFPLLPFGVALASVGLGLLLELLESSASPRVSSAAGTVWTAIVVLAIATFLTDFRGQRREYDDYAAGLTRYAVLARRLRMIKPPGSDPVLATVEAGLIPYVSGWRTIDTYGLNDATIALSWKHDPDFVVSQHPDLVIVSSKSTAAYVPAEEGLAFEAALLDRCLQQGMVKVGSVTFEDGYYLWLLAKPDGFVARGLAEQA